MPSGTWAPPAPYDLARTLRVLRRGRGDPACRQEPDGSWWRCSHTPEGPVTLRITDRSDAIAGGLITGTAWGPGTDWALKQLPALLGADDELDAFRPRHRVVAAAHRKHRGLRLARTGLVMESLVPSVLEQRITTGSAHYAWRRLLNRYGEQPPGPAPDGMRIPPSTATAPERPRSCAPAPTPRAWRKPRPWSCPRRWPGSSSFPASDPGPPPKRCNALSVPPTP